jgi:protein subunit release factor A
LNNKLLVIKTRLLHSKLLLLFLFLNLLASAQEEAKLSSLQEQLPDKAFTSLFEKSAGTEAKLDNATQKYLSKLLKQEQKLQKKIYKKDSLKAEELFEGVEQKYASLQNAPEKLKKYKNVYSGHLDSLTTSLKFLQAQNLSNPELQKTLSQFSSLQGKLNQAEYIKKFLNERKKLLKENLEKLGMLKELKGFSKQAYYYSAQLKEYKAMWEDPSKLEKKLLEWVMKSDKFKEFFRKHSQLGSLFALPGSGASMASLQGLQTRASVQQAIASRFGTGTGVQQMLQQNMQAAQGQLNELKAKLGSLGSGSFGNSGSDIDMPDGFKPNSQKTKTFLDRLEYGANIQNQKARSYFPVTSDIGLSLGYKLNDKSAVGIGASYKLGWGSGWNNIKLSSEGLGLRTYLDYKLKGTFYISGGYEQNYRTAFSSIDQLKDYSAWQSSGLLGLSKKYKVSKKLKGEMKLLWDFLSYQQIPKTQTILFRIGYNLK